MSLQEEESVFKSISTVEQKLAPVVGLESEKQELRPNRYISESTGEFMEQSERDILLEKLYGKVGVEKITALVKKVADVILPVLHSLEDGFQLLQDGGVILAMFPQALGVIADAKAADPELKDLTWREDIHIFRLALDRADDAINPMLNGLA